MNKFTNPAPMKKIRNIHPGEILSKEFLLPRGISKYRLSKETGIRQMRLSAIVRGRRRITPDVARRLAGYFKTGPVFWTALQNDYDKKRRLY